MRLGMSIGGESRLSSFLERVAMFEEAGLDTAWCSQLFGIDALTMFAVAGTMTSRIRFGTAVIPTRSRHPLVLASQALTTSAATDGRLVLGIGSSHRDLVEGVLGQSYERPAAHLREYVGVLRRLLDGERFEHHGEFIDVDTTTDFGRAHVVDGQPPQLLVGTMFPLSLKVAGSLADGVVTWLVGLRTLTEVIAPITVDAAAAAGRPRPEVIAGVPMAVCASGDVAEQNDLVNRSLERFTSLPVYESVLQREQADVPRRPRPRRGRGDRCRATGRVSRRRHRRGPRCLLRGPGDVRSHRHPPRHPGSFSVITRSRRRD